jgi:transcriptional regulator of acetoin/glycerol metabolism
MSAQKKFNLTKNKLIKILNKNNGDVVKTSKILSLSYVTIYRYIKQFGLTSKRTTKWS